MGGGKVHFFPVRFWAYLKELLVWENEIPGPEGMGPCPDSIRMGEMIRYLRCSFLV